MDQKKMQIFSVLIILYNLISTLFYGVSIVSIIILGVNLYLTITNLKRYKNNKFEKINLILEIITAIVILFSLL